MDDQEIWCDICARNGLQTKLKSFQINLDEAVVLCQNTKCPYPIDSTFTILKRKATDLPPSVRKRRKHSISSASSVASNSPPPIFHQSETKSKLLNGCAINKSLKPVSILSKTVPNATSVNPVGSGKLAGQKVSITVGGTQGDGSAFLPYQSTPQSRLCNISTAVDNSKTDKSLCNIIPSEHSSIKTIESPQVIPKTQEAQQLPGTEGLCYVNKTNLCYPQWMNKDALCWLDVAMCVLTQCLDAKLLLDGIVKTLLKSYSHALLLLNPILQDPSSRIVDLDQEKIPVKVGGGDVINSSNTQTLVTSVVNPASKMHDVLPGSRELANATLDTVREEVFQYLQPRLKCIRGRQDSPLFALDSLLRESESLSAMFNLDYKWEMTCSVCGHQQVDKYSDIIPSLPELQKDFSMGRPYFVRSCFKCEAKGQQRNMQFDCLPPRLLFHFTHGLPHARLSEYDFTFKGGRYRLTALIQHKTGPQHFVAWIRDLVGDLWMECDDMKSSVTQYLRIIPDIPPSEVHIVLWEQVGQSKHGNAVDNKKLHNPPNILRCDAKTISNAVNLNAVKSNCKVSNVVNANSVNGDCGVKNLDTVESGGSATSVSLPSIVSSVKYVQPSRVNQKPLTGSVRLLNTNRTPCLLNVGQMVGSSVQPNVEVDIQRANSERAKARLDILQGRNQHKKWSKVSRISHLGPPKSVVTHEPLDTIEKLNKSHPKPVNGLDLLAATDEKTAQFLAAFKKAPFKGYRSKRDNSGCSSGASTPSSEVSNQRGRTVKFLLDNLITSKTKSCNVKRLHANIDKAINGGVASTKTPKKSNSSIDHKSDYADNVLNGNKPKCLVANNVLNGNKPKNPTASLPRNESTCVSSENNHSDTNSVLAELYKCLDIEQSGQSTGSQDLDLGDDFISELLSPEHSLNKSSEDSMEKTVLDSNLPSDMDVDLVDFDIDNFLFS